MRRIAQLIATGAGWLSRRAGRGGGTSLPGMVLLRMRPRAAEELSGGLTRGAVAISATNGKTTTARLVRSVLDAEGMAVVANSAGANLLTGVTAALLDASRRSEPQAEIGLFEVDEAALPAVADQVHPSVVVLMNLFRDQLDRYGELETLLVRWRTMIASLPDHTTLVLNADDPATAVLGMERDRVLTFGVDDPGVDRHTLAHAADSTHCPRCDQPLTYDLITIGHQGHWRCTSCGLQRSTPDIVATSVTLDGVDGLALTARTPDGPVDVRVALPGLHNAYNVLAALGTAVALGLDIADAAKALGTTKAAFGRAEHVEIDGRRLVLLLAKNPAGANENIRTVLCDPEPVHVMVMLNDRTADGRDVSWIWDVDHEPLFDRLAHLVVAGDRAEDLALRFRYGGLPTDGIVVEREAARALDALVAATPVGGTAYVLPTYTAMLDLRAELVRRGVAQAFWESA
jgi:UDP-N-acetylmuramyl tripeptide synthase